MALQDSGASAPMSDADAELDALLARAALVAVDRVGACQGAGRAGPVSLDVQLE